MQSAYESKKIKAFGRKQSATDFVSIQSAFTLIELLVVMAIILILVAVLIPSISGAREQAQRSKCAVNLKTILTCFHLYAQEYNNTYPAVKGPPASTPGQWKSFNRTIIGASTLENIMYSYYVDNSNPRRIGNTADAVEGSVTGCLWVMALRQQLKTAIFICPSDTYSGSPISVGGGTSTSYCQADFASTSKANTLSYSIAYPWHASGTGSNAPVGRWWRNTGMSDLPIISDMAPANGEYYGDFSIDVTNAKAKAPETCNSYIHSQLGQNVGYADGHVIFAKRPNVGQNGDNIWTENGTGGPSATGSAIKATESTFLSAGYTTIGLTNTDYNGGNGENIDVVMVPVRSSVFYLSK